MRVTDGYYRWEFRLRAGETPDDLDERRVLELIGPWLGGVDPDKVTILRRAWYTFRGVVADRWQLGRVFLLGDAAHLTPPFIGQGMCAGIRDAANLTWKLALVLDGRADDRLLATYEAERRPYARRVVQMAIAVGWLMTGGSARTSRLRRAALRFVTRLPGVEDRAMTAAWPAFRNGPLTAADDPLAGRLFPQPRVGTHAGEVLLDQALGDGFAVLTRGPHAGEAFDPATRAFFAGLGTSSSRCPPTGAVVDGALTGLLDGAGADALLLRPDRVIAASGARSDLRGWRRQLQSAGMPTPGGVVVTAEVLAIVLAVVLGVAGDRQDRRRPGHAEGGPAPGVQRRPVPGHRRARARRRNRAPRRPRGAGHRDRGRHRPRPPPDRRREPPTSSTATVCPASPSRSRWSRSSRSTGWPWRERGEAPRLPGAPGAVRTTREIPGSEARIPGPTVTAE